MVLDDDGHAHIGHAVIAGAMWAGGVNNWEWCGWWSREPRLKSMEEHSIHRVTKTNSRMIRGKLVFGRSSGLNIGLEINLRL